MPEETVSIIALLRDQVSAPANLVRNALGGIKETVAGLQEAFEPLTGRITEFIAAFATFETVNKSLEAAQEAATAVAKLRAALGTDIDQLASIQQKAEDIQRTTIHKSDDILETAVELLNRGVTTNQISEALDASTKLADAFGESVQAAGEQIAITYEGILPRGLGRAVPELQRLTIEQLKQGDAVNIIAKRYGEASSALVNTPFGKAQQQANSLNDVYIQLGNVFINIKTAIYGALIPALQGLANELTSPSGERFIAVLIKVLAFLVSNADKVIVFIGALKLLNITLGVTTALFELFTSPVTLTIAAVLALGVGIVALAQDLGLIDTGIHSFGDLKKIIGDTFDRISDGTLTFSTFILTVEADLKKTGEYFKLYFYEVPLNALKNLLADAPTLGGFLTGTIANASGADPSTLASIGAALSNTSQSTGDLIKSRSADIEANNATDYTAILNRALDTQANIDSATFNAHQVAQEKSDKAAGDAAIANRKVLYDKLAALDDGTAQQNAEKAAKNSKDIADAEFKAREIGLQEYLDLTQKKERDDLQLSLDDVNVKLKAAQQSQTSLEGLGADRTGKDEVALNKSLSDQIALRQQVINLTQQQTDLARAQVAASLDAADKYAQQAQQELGKQTQRASSLVDIGQLSSTAEQQRDTQAYQQYKTAINEAIKVDQALADSEKDPARHAAIEQRIQDLQETAAITEAQVKGSIPYYEAQIRQGIESPLTNFVASALGNISNIGSAFGKLLQDISGQLLNFVASSIVKKFLDVLGGTSGTGASSGGGFIGLIAGAAASFFAAEGGPTPNVGVRGIDSIPSMLAPGEFVQPHTAVDYYGAGAMEAIRTRSIPASVLRAYARGGIGSGGPLFASGGLVNGSTGSGHGGIVPAVVAPTGENFRRLINGGKNEMFDFLSQNATKIKNVLNITK